MKSQRKILIVDDETNLRRVLRAQIEEMGYLVDEAANGAAGLKAATESVYDLVLTDVVMPQMDGVAMLGNLREAGFGGPVVVLTAYGSVETAVAAMKAGAFDFLEKSAAGENLAAIIEKAIRQSAAEETEIAKDDDALENVIGASDAMKLILEQIPAIAESQAAVLITGESGTGKTLLARTIHDRSRRRSGPFVAVNSSAIPAGLAESELFGHERGAFTGAVARRPGRFEIASGGTLFLDEIGELDLSLQAKLLKAIEEKKIERLGGTSSIPVDVRVMAATNRDLDAARREGRFREDLFYRLNVIPLRIPPLRERPEDIPPLVMRKMGRVCRELDHLEVSVTDAAMKALRANPWPGNVRELENVIERTLVFLKSDRLDVKDLPPEISGGAGKEPQEPRPVLRDARRDAESDRIREALREKNGNVTHAAELLGISRRGLQIKMKEYGLR